MAWPDAMPAHELPGLFALDVRFVDVHSGAWRARVDQEPVR